MQNKIFLILSYFREDYTTTCSSDTWSLASYGSEPDLKWKLSVGGVFNNSPSPDNNDRTRKCSVYNDRSRKCSVINDRRFSNDRTQKYSNDRKCSALSNDRKCSGLSNDRKCSALSNDRKCSAMSNNDRTRKCSVVTDDRKFSMIPNDNSRKCRGISDNQSRKCSGMNNDQTNSPIANSTDRSGRTSNVQQQQLLRPSHNSTTSNRSLNNLHVGNCKSGLRKSRSPMSQIELMEINNMIIREDYLISSI